MISGLEKLTSDRFVIPKSRYASVSSYLTEENQNFNDIELVIDPEAEKFLNDAGMDPILSRHFAHLWIRDPMTLWKDGVELDDEKQSDHFENLQSTNWQTLRFKPPPPNSPIGWRVEFRPMEIQFTEFENAAYSIFIVLVTRVLLRWASQEFLYSQNPKSRTFFMSDLFGPGKTLKYVEIGC